MQAFYSSNQLANFHYKEVAIMRAAGKTAEEQYQLILECRRSGMSDCDWCREKGIKLDTCACYKRLDGSIQGRFRWPRSREEVKPITWKQFDWLMSGLELEQPKALKRAIGSVK